MVQYRRVSSNCIGLIYRTVSVRGKVRRCSWGPRMSGHNRVSLPVWWISYVIRWIRQNQWHMDQMPFKLPNSFSRTWLKIPNREVVGTCKHFSVSCAYSCKWLPKWTFPCQPGNTEIHEITRFLNNTTVHSNYLATQFTKRKLRSIFKCFARNNRSCLRGTST